MARKHKKNRGIMKQGVDSVTVKPEKRSTERKVVLNPKSGEYEIVHIETVVPAVVKQGRAFGPTTRYGLPNTGGQKEKSK